MAPLRLVALASLLISLLGCGAPGRAPAARDLGRGEEALAAGRLEEAEALLSRAERAAVGPGLDAGLRRRALRGLVSTRLAVGDFEAAQEALFALRGLGERGPELARRAARVALVTGRDIPRTQADLRARATTSEDEATLARLALRLGEPATSSLAPATGDQGRLLALERGLPDPAPGRPPATPELAAELLARELDAGRTLAPERLGTLTWPSRAAWLRDRMAWLSAGPEDPVPELFQARREAGPAAPDARLHLLAATRGPELLPVGKRLPVARSGGQLVDRDPISPRRGADDRPRVLVAVWPGLSARYLRASLEAGHFPYLAAWAARGAFLDLPTGTTPVPPEGAAAPHGDSLPDRPESRRRRLFPDGVPEPPPEALISELLAYDRQLEVRTLGAAMHHEEHRPPITWVELPGLEELRPRLLPLLVDCPPPGALPRRLADEVRGLGDTLDRVVRRLEVWAGRMVPMIDRDDHVLVASPSGQPGEGGFLLVMGPGVRSGTSGRAAFSLERLGDLATWLAAGRPGAPPEGAEAFLRERPASPFQR
jgi:hypothetical protein